MTTLHFDSYRSIFKNSSFTSFWIGFTFSVLGDAMTRVVLIWYVYEKTKSAQALGILTIAYTAPILLGGLVAGTLLDRFPRQAVMIVDNIIRGLAIAAIPLINLLGTLEVWHAYAFAAVYGSLMMISLAGGPALIPSIVSKEQLDTANALETLSFTLSGIIGPPLAGFLIVWLGAANVTIIDAVSYFVFAALLFFVRPGKHGAESGEHSTNTYSLIDAVRLLRTNIVLLSTTLMFMAFNIGNGILNVALPIYSDQIAGGGSGIYGTLLGILSAGEVLSASLAGSLVLSLSLGKRIALAQLLSIAGLLGLLAGPFFLPAAAGLFTYGFFSAPLTIWAQTLRMQVIPPALRGRTFSLLRTLMQGATPVGGALGGFLLPLFGIPLMILFSAVLIGIPGLAGLRIPELREAGKESGMKLETG